jgi:transposase
LDESTFKLEPYITKGWFKIGSRPIKKYALNKSQKIHVFGAVGSKRRFVKLSEKINSKKFLAFVKLLKKNVRKLCIVTDNGRWHLTREIMSFVKEKKIVMIRIPPYSPEVNPIEQYWKNNKNYLATKAYFDKKSLVREVKKSLRKDILVPKISDY